MQYIENQASLSLAPYAGAVDFSRIVFFGDSLSDNGNLYRLIRVPGAPYVDGRFSNGPTFAEIVPGLIGVDARNYAFGGAEAVTNPSLFALISLNVQVTAYLASLPGGQAPEGTAATLFIGNNDYLGFDPGRQDSGALVNDVLGSIGLAALRLLSAGVDRLILFTLPSTTATPLGEARSDAENAQADALVDAHNAGIHRLSTTLDILGVHVTLVDIHRLLQEVSVDAETFGFKTMIPFVSPDASGRQVPTGIDSQFRPDQIAFFDQIHPSAAGHGVQAAFVAATLAADRVTLMDGGANAVNGSAGMDLIFTGAGNDVIGAGAGNDIVFAGIGDDLVQLGAGHDLAAGGSGNDIMLGGEGDDLLAGNLGQDVLRGGAGNDVLIAGQGADRLYGEFGDDLFILDVEALLAGGTAFISGGAGLDTLRLSAHGAFESLEAAFQNLAAFAASPVIAALGLTLEGLERVELAEDGVVVASLGAPGAPSGHAATTLLGQADLWGLI